MTGVRAINNTVVTSIDIGPTSFVRDKTSGKLVRDGAEENDTAVSIRIGNNAMCNTAATARTGEGGKVNSMMDITLRFL